METIAKLIKAMFFTEGEVQATTAQKVKDTLLIMLITTILVFAGLYYLADGDDEEDSQTSVEYVDEGGIDE